MRSRVVNAKRSDLSKGVRRRVARDNRDRRTGNLRGCDRRECTPNHGDEQGRLVRGFFGHTRFATSSIASLDGTHPHRWCPWTIRGVYPFGSPSFASRSGSEATPRPRRVGVENYVTHNGDFEFFNVNGRYYDVEVVQRWLEKVLGTPMPAAVDSGE